MYKLVEGVVRDHDLVTNFKMSKFYPGVFVSDLRKSTLSSAI